VTLVNGETGTFSLSAVASSATPTPTSTDSGQSKAVYAGVILPLAFGQSKTPSLLLTALALGMLLMTGKLRRRHLVVLAMALILAATEVGCGNTTTGITGTSTQAVQTITASSGGSTTGLPATLGSITVQ
jgi:O-antigen ligase